jgi:hypothetical protein
MAEIWSGLTVFGTGLIYQFSIKFGKLFMGYMGNSIYGLM